MSLDANGVGSWRDNSGGGGLPSGTANQTLRHNGTSWVADGYFKNYGNSIRAGDNFQVDTQDAFGRRQIWYKNTNSVLRLGSDTADGDPTNADSEGIVVYQPSADNMARIKADRFGLTRASDSSYYYFRVDKTQLFYKSTDTTQTRFKIDNTTGNVGINTSSPQAKLDINDINGYNQFRLQTKYTPTGSLDPNGQVGAITWDDNYIYVKTPSGWKRAPLSSW